MWRTLRIALLLLTLAGATFYTWRERTSSTDWDETLWIGVFPVNADGAAAGRDYIAALDPPRVADIERFINEEARRHGVTLTRPVRVDLYPEVFERPPDREPDASALSNIWWSLKLRLYARRNSHPAGRAPPTIRVFVLYHDPGRVSEVPHSVGLQKGLVGVVHAFADRDMTRVNNVVIAHEILHTLGATDKYDLTTLAPLYPEGFAEPQRNPRYPQEFAEIMAGRIAVDAGTFEMPESLGEVIVGAATAREIGWVRAP